MVLCCVIPSWAVCKKSSGEQLAILCSLIGPYPPLLINLNRTDNIAILYAWLAYMHHAVSPLETTRVHELHFCESGPCLGPRAIEAPT